MKVALLHLGNADDGQRPTCGERLLWVAHHLITDGVSWRILLEDFQTIYQQISQGKTVQLPAKTTSWQQWATCLQNYAHSEALQQELPHWLNTTSSIPNILHSSVDTSHNTGANAKNITINLTPAETQSLLQELPSRHHTQIQNVLLTALLQTFRQCSGESSLCLDLEGHGRSDLFSDQDISRTIGWFTTLFPVQLTAPENATLTEVLQAVKTQLQQVPQQGIGYGLLRYLNTSEVTDDLRDRPSATLRFNYLGQLDRGLQTTDLFKLASESCGIERSLRNPRPYLLDISAFVAEGQFQMQWSYSHAVHKAATIQTLADTFLGILRLLLKTTPKSSPLNYLEPIRINGI
ncbi:MAG TPA: condensation domain-containing protein, partial [Allocoleopsis sp.]